MTRHDPRPPRLGHRLCHAVGLLRPGVVLRPARRPQHLGVLRLGPRRALVARRPVDGRNDVQQRHAKPGHRHRAAHGRRRQLGVVGVRADRRVDGVLLRAAVAPLWRPHRPRVLRDPLLRPRRQRRPWLSRGVSRTALQLHDHGDRQSCRVQDRRHPVRPGALADTTRRRHPQRRVRRALGTLGRARHRHDPVLHQDDGGHRRGVVRVAGAAGRGPDRAHRQAVGNARSGRHRLSRGAARLLEPLGYGGGGVHHAHCGAVVGGVVSGRGAGRRQLYRAADARVQIRKRRAWRGALLQRRALRAASVAVDSRRPVLDSRLSRSCPTSSARFRISIRGCSATTSPIRRC